MAGNLVANPSAVTDTSGWSASNATLSRITNDGVATGTSFNCARNTTGGNHQMFYSVVAFPAGKKLAVALQYRTDDSLIVQVTIDWYTAADGYISTSSDAYVAQVAWTRFAASYLAPATTAKAQIVVKGFASGFAESPNGSTYRITDVSLQQAAPYARLRPQFELRPY